MPNAFQFQNITKTFGAVKANSQVSFTVEDTAIHGVVGENGAGKSTIMKILYGLYPPDSGKIFVREKECEIRSPQAAIGLGIGMVHQHFMLVPTLSVWENVVLGGEPTLFKLNKKEICEKLDHLQKDFGFSLNLEARIQTLPVGLQQQVEILKLLYRDASILILDEPTAVLTPQEVTGLFEKLKTLKKKGKTIVLITHKLKEILSFTESVTVMRQGHAIETVKTLSLTENLLAEKIIGRKQVTLPTRQTSKASKPVLSVKNLSLPQWPNVSLSFDIGPGEILGIAGIEGNGQHDLVEMIVGVKRHYHGDILYQDHPLKNRETYSVKQEGLAVIPPDRHAEGILLEFTVLENAILGHHREPYFTKKGFLSHSKIRGFTSKMLEQFDVRPRDPDLPISALSGGNQQKVVVGRETAAGEVKLLIAAHPTRGVDIGAIEFIHTHFLKLREKGVAILLISSELEEILALSDRILVLYQGHIIGETKPSEATEKRLGLWMTGCRE